MLKCRVSVTFSKNEVLETERLEMQLMSTLRAGGVRSGEGGINFSKDLHLRVMMNELKS